MILDVKHLYFDYADEPILKDIHFSLAAGELLHMTGANGVGKTTLLKILATLLQPLQGMIEYQQQPLTDETLAEYREAICYISHKPGVNALLTPREHWQYDLMRPGSHSFKDAMLQLELSHCADKLCGLLSAGQRRRVSLLHLIAKPAVLWLLDEPWVALDVEGSQILKSMIEVHLQHGGSVITTSHQPIPFASSFYRVYAL